MYILYFDKSEQVITVKKAHKALQKLDYTDEVTQYNSCYYICSKKAPLVEEAKEIKRIWISEIEQALNKVKEIKL
jgi:hypothetical protein